MKCSDRTTYKMWKILAIAVLFSCNALGNIVRAPRVEIDVNEVTHVALEPNEASGFDLGIHGVVHEDIAHIGRTFNNIAQAQQTEITNGVIFDLGNDVNLTFNVNSIEGGFKISISWKAPNNQRLEDCFDLGDKHWYGGPEQKQQYWPTEKLTLVEYSYIAKELDNSGIMEPYFLNSAGQYIYVQRQSPLFIDENNILSNHICLIAKVESPYSSMRTHNELTYDFIVQDNVRVAHQHAIDTYLGKPSGLPDTRMIQYPIWSTWAKFSRPINQSLMLDFAQDIVDSGFKNSQFEIDDLWEVCYGSLTIDENKFPDMAGLVTQIKELGFRVTLWIHPFINLGCEPWYTEALTNGYLVRNEQGSVTTSWWNDNGTEAAYIDFTNPEASNWWSSRLKNLQSQYGFDSFKFDAGEMSWTPQVSVLTVEDINLHPAQIIEKYVRLCAEFGDLIEIRTGVGTQDLPVMVRVIDKDTYWTFEDNGLPTLITSVLQINLNGYPFVLPDMIGGNGYYDEVPSRELFVRWLQANTFMPVLQFSFVPFDYDDEIIAICHKFTDLHAEYSDEIIKAMQAAVTDGTPVNAPIWWIAPTDEEALVIWDEYLLGENILVAPVVVEGAVSRDIYLPAGVWLAEGDPEKVYEGGQWIENYPAPLDTLPYFIKSGVGAISGTIFSFILAVVVLVFGRC